ncbi:hypothetical protein HMPREF1318_2759 [Actinomyces massiliensis F0489]|uniref:Uncharacterized protein n=1 Tax=Actinomyces massiliensis F0489 TaxID=1125718 RepID=J1HJI9_9ACTO|nr:hypothetical protein HMPREF1318_2759 [Actinomyces massiliensis F0489]
MSSLRLGVGTSGPLRYGPEAIRLNLAGLPEEGAARTRQRSCLTRDTLVGFR